MKPLHKQLILITQLLIITTILQSCSVYESYPTSLDVAVNSTKMVKVKLNNDETYEFIRLVRDDENQLYGIAPVNSKTSIALSNKIAEAKSNNLYVQILLEVDEIKGIYFEDDGNDENYTRGVRDAFIFEIISAVIIDKLF
jgi:hypothetical protein